MHTMFKILMALLLTASVMSAQGVPSLYTDIKARGAGDVLSVILAENANASRESKTNNKTSSQFALDAGTSGNVASVLPSLGGSSSTATNSNDADGQQQNDRLTGRITVRIVEQTPAGMFRIEGERQLGVNGEDNVMKLEGLVRPRDISTYNTIYSFNIADAKITYRKGGLTNKFMKPGTMTKVFTYLLGGLMVAAGAGYFAFK